VWAQELDARRDLLTDQLVRAAPGLQVTGVRFVVGDHVIPVPPTVRPRTVPMPTAQETAQAEKLFDTVIDADLRERLVRAAAGQLAIARANTKKPAKSKKPGA
jgi:hypothetical protein